MFGLFSNFRILGAIAVLANFRRLEVSISENYVCLDYFSNLWILGAIAVLANFRRLEVSIAENYVCLDYFRICGNCRFLFFEFLEIKGRCHKSHAFGLVTNLYRSGEFPHGEISANYWRLDYLRLLGYFADLSRCGE